MKPEPGRPYRVFISGNCQLQFVFDALKLLYRDHAGIAVSFRATYQAPRPGDETLARQCDAHIVQITNLERDPWREMVPAAARRIRVPALQLPGIFHAFAPRVHPDHALGGRPPYYLARGNKLLNELARRFRQGEDAERLVADYLDFTGHEIEMAPRLLEMNVVSMRRIGLHSDFDLWREIEPRLARERFFWSVKHPTLAVAMILLRRVLDALELPYDPAALDALGQGPEYHEPYHAPIHPRLAERLGLTWAGVETKYRLFQNYFTAAEHARHYIAGNFRPEFTLNKAIRDARARADPAATADLFRSCRAHFPSHGQADFWYGRVLQRAGRHRLALFQYERALAGARAHPHATPHRADIAIAKIEACLRRCRRAQGQGARGTGTISRMPDIATLRAQIARLEADEARLNARIRWWNARNRLRALAKVSSPLEGEERNA